MDAHLNFFKPYASVAASHENQLTRALVVVLRYSPIAHQCWLSQIDADLQLSELDAPSFEVQQQRLLREAVDVPEGESVRGISVWLAPDAVQIYEKIETSDRLQVLDAVVTYGQDLVVVVENKIYWAGHNSQPHKINLHGAPVLFTGSPRSVAWQKVLSAFADIVERDLVSGAEKLLIGDFLSFVDLHFPHIGPYSDLRRCGGHRFRVERRLDAIQGAAVGREDGKSRGWRNLEGTKKVYMAWLGLDATGTRAEIRMFPGDTLGQARSLYGDPSSVQDVLALRSMGWTVEPNFHWGFMAGGYVWLASPLSVDAYCAYWTERISQTREIARSEWESYWEQLVADRVVDDAGKTEFDREFTASQRMKVNPRPGLCCSYSWPLAEATKLDSQGKFVEVVRGRIDQLLAALRAPALPNHRPCAPS